ncbi:MULTISPECIES: phage holin family protein [Jannaschia]|nr:MULTISPECIES: phage holin family protein [unclassified Jannaschia]
MGLLDAVSRVLRAEAALAKAEVGENLGRMGVALAAVVTGGIIAILALGALLCAAVAGAVALGLPVWAASLLVAVVLFGLAGGLFAWGLSGLKARRLIPTRSLSNVQRDFDVLKEAFDGGSFRT